MKVYIDQGVHQGKIKNLRQKYGFEAIYHQNLEQDIKPANAEPGVAVLDQSFFDSGDYFADSDIVNFQKTIGTSTKQDKIDVAHLYTAFHAKCDYFVTNNPDSFIYENSRNKKSDQKRKDLEVLTKGLRIITLDEFESILTSLIPEEVLVAENS